MATALSSVKWRVQMKKNSLVDSEIYYIEFTAQEVTKDQLSDLVASFRSLGFVSVSFGLVVTV